jgi:stage II sporulation protein D
VELKHALIGYKVDTMRNTKKHLVNKKFYLHLVELKKGKLFAFFLIPLVLLSYSEPVKVKEHLYQTAFSYLQNGNYIGALEIFHFLGNYKNSKEIWRKTAQFFKSPKVKNLKKEPNIGVKILSEFRKVEIYCPKPSKYVKISDKLLKNKKEITLFLEKNCKLSADGIVYFKAPLKVRVKIYSRPRILVVELPLETYLLGVLPAEVYPSWNLEALKAQAVASRTFALFNIYKAREAGKLFDVGSDTGYQVFKGFFNTPPNIKKAVAETRGEVLIYKGGLIYAMFHSNNGGCNHSFKEITGLELPYLSEVRDNCNSKSLKWNHWNIKLSKGRVKNFLKKLGVDGTLKGFKPSRNSCGRILKLTFETSGGYVTVPFSIFGRLQLHLPSDWFFVLGKTGHYYLLAGRGFGHGLGMSQWGALCYSLKGWNYKQILKHYYKGIEIRKIYK